jgi:hypothetical protein
MDFHTLTEAARILKRSFSRSFKEYEGSPEDICKQIVADCWNGTYFQTSAGHFSGFYVRDFAWVVDALLHMDYKKEVRQTLEYALEHFQRNGKITTTLTPKGKGVDIHDIGPDSLALLLTSLRAAKARSLVKKHKRFLEEEAIRYKRECINPATGLIQRHKYFSSMKDMYKRDSSCYDNWMLAIISRELNYFKLSNPFKDYNYDKLIEKTFWNNNHYWDDMSRTVISSDANIVPCFWDLIDDKKKNTVLSSIRKQGLCRPLPAKYTSQRNTKQELTTLKLVAGNYEGTAIWMHLGVMYLTNLAKTNKPEAKKALKQFHKLIKKYKTFPEVLSEDGKKPFSTPFYFCDEAMIWAANIVYAEHLLHE